MPFEHGGLVGCEQLADAAQLLHDMCFERVKLETPKLSYEPRWSCQCKDCAAVWIASKSGDVMRIELRANPPKQSWFRFRGNHEARTVYHVHDGAALGGGSFLLIGRDDGVLDIIPDLPEEWADHAPPPHRQGSPRSFHLDSWWASVPAGAERSEERKVTEGFERAPCDPMGITAIAVVPWGPVDTLDILVATRHPSLYVIEATRGQVRIRRPRRMPGWIQWIIGPPDDERITCISRGGHIVRLTRDALVDRRDVSPATVALLPTAAMPFDGGSVLLGTTTGLFLVRDGQAEVAVPVTRSPVLCLDRAEVRTGDTTDGDKHDYIAMGLEDGRLRIVDAELILALATGAARPVSHDHNFVIEQGDAVLAVETLQLNAPPHAAHVLTVLRDHSVRLYRVTSQPTQREKVLRLWRELVERFASPGDGGAPATPFDTELAAADASLPDCTNAWRYMLVDVVLPRLCAMVPVDNGARRDAHRRIVALACEIAAPGRAPAGGARARAPRPEAPDLLVLHGLSIRLGLLTGGDVDLQLELSRTILGAVPRGNSERWEAFIASHVRELNAIARDASDGDLERLVAWARFVRKYILLGHTFAAKRLGLGELVKQNYEIRKFLDALIYQTRLLQRSYDLCWASRVDEEVAELHLVDCGAGRAIVVIVTADAKLAFVDGADGRRLKPGALDVITPICDGRRGRTLASAVVGLHDHPPNVLRDETAFRVVLSCTGTHAPAPSGLAVYDLRWSAKAGALELIDSCLSVPCDGEPTPVHAVQPLPRWPNAFVVGLETSAAPVGLLLRDPDRNAWTLELAHGGKPIDPADGDGPPGALERRALAPGKLPTRALDVAFDDRVSRYLVVAGSDDGLVRAISFAWGERPRYWRVKPWDRMADAVVSIALVRHLDSEDSPFSCYLGTDAGDTFALSILARRQRDASTTVLPFGDYDAQALWRDTQNSPVLAVRMWHTKLYTTRDVLVVVTEAGRLCIYNHSSERHVSASYNYLFRGLRLDRVSLPGRLRALITIGDDRFVAAGPGELYMGELVYLRNSIHRPIPEWRRAPPAPPSVDPSREPADDLASKPRRLDPQQPLPPDIWARLRQLFDASMIAKPFKIDDGSAGELKSELCDLVRLEGGALSGYMLRKRWPPERWHTLDEDGLRNAAHGLLDRLDPEDPEDAERSKILIKSLCRAFLFSDPELVKDEIVNGRDSMADHHERIAVACEIAADHLKFRLVHSTAATARLRIVVIKELLRVPTLRSMARGGPYGDRVRAAVESALDSCLHDDHRLVRIEAMRALSIALRNVGIMYSHIPDDREAIITALFPGRLASVEWLLRLTVGGLLRFPSFTPRTAQVSGAWHLIWALLPLFHIFPNYTLALCDYLVRAGLGIEVLDMCGRSLRGQWMARVRSRIVHLYLIPAGQSRDEYCRRYDTRRPEHQELLSTLRLSASSATTVGDDWHEIDDTVMAARITQLLDRLARMWSVESHEQMVETVAKLRPATPARKMPSTGDRPLAALEDMVHKLASIAKRLAKANADEAGDLDRLLGELGQHTDTRVGEPKLTAPLRKIVTSIVELWRKLYKPPLRAGTTLSREHVGARITYTAGEPIGGLATAFTSLLDLREPSELRDRYVIRGFAQSAPREAANRFSKGAWINRELCQKSPNIVEVKEVFDHPHRAYVMRKYSGILEAYLTEDFHASSDVLNGFGALECTEWVAAQIGSALRVVHDAGHYHGDVKPANIAIDFNKDDVPGFHLGDFYLAYPPSSEGLPPGPVSIVPKCLSRKCRDADGLRQWDDVAALSLVLYRMLTGKTVDPRRTESLRKHADRLRKLASAKRIANRPGAGRVIEAVLRVFDDGDAFGVAAFVDSLAPRPPDRRRRTKAKILWLAANPAGTNPVELENELGGLEKLLKAAPSRGRIKFTAKHAVDTQDLVDHVSELLPTVVHFSGHGSSEGIVIQHERQGLRVIAGEHLRTFFEDRGVQLVVLNSCFSEPQAKAILPVVRAVVGTAGRLEVGAALLFATSFYRTLANGKPVGEAFRNGCDAVGLGGSPDVFKILGDRDLTIV